MIELLGLLLTPALGVAYGLSIDRPHSLIHHYTLTHQTRRKP